jgi:bifunctional DNA-binding transcriptional regulator/antitoxin component of YhaV-PrlF toxin-antitoxin module
VFAEILHKMAIPLESAETVQIRDRGVLTLPKSLRERYDLKTGDALRLVDLDGVFLLTPLAPMVPELAREIARLREEAGLSVDELVSAVREQRARYHEGHRGD